MAYTDAKAMAHRSEYSRSRKRAPPTIVIELSYDERKRVAAVVTVLVTLYRRQARAKKKSVMKTNSAKSR